MTRRPLVAVAPSRFAAGRIGRWTDSGEAVPSMYLDGLRRAGAVPVALGGPEDLGPEELDDFFDGVVLIGGSDIDPAWYGEDRHPAVYDVNDERDRFELGLVRTALAAVIPLFAVCRGLQVLNVALGGSLWQHLPDVGVERDVDRLGHGVPTGEGEPALHPVEVVPHTRLAAAVGHSGILTGCTSIHHQAVKTLAPGLVVTAVASDGVIESVELPMSDRRWCLGVQWHPERTAATDPAQQALFGAFVSQCASRRVAAPSVDQRRAG